MPVLLRMAPEMVARLPRQVVPSGTRMVRVAPLRSMPLEKVVTAALVCAGVRPEHEAWLD